MCTLDWELITQAFVALVGSVPMWAFLGAWLFREELRARLGGDGPVKLGSLELPAPERLRIAIEEAAGEVVEEEPDAVTHTETSQSDRAVLGAALADLLPAEYVNFLRELAAVGPHTVSGKRREALGVGTLLELELIRERQVPGINRWQLEISEKGEAVLASLTHYNRALERMFGFGSYGDRAYGE